MDQKNAQLKESAPPSKPAQRKKLRAILGLDNGKIWNPDTNDFVAALSQGGVRKAEIAWDIFTLLEIVVRNAYGSRWIAEAARKESALKVKAKIGRLNIMTHAKPELVSLIGDVPTTATENTSFGDGHPECGFRNPIPDLLNPSWLDDDTLKWLSSQFEFTMGPPEDASKKKGRLTRPPPRGTITRDGVLAAFSDNAHVFVYACAAGAGESGVVNPNLLRSLAKALNVAVSGFSKDIRFKATDTNVKSGTVKYNLSLVEPSHGPDLTPPTTDFRRLDALALEKDLVVRIGKPRQP